jgi:hypothetical protein
MSNIKIRPRLLQTSQYEDSKLASTWLNLHQRPTARSEVIGKPGRSFTPRYGGKLGERGSDLIANNC